MYGHKEESFSWPQKPGSRIKTPVSAVFFSKTIAAFFPGRQYWDGSTGAAMQLPQASVAWVSGAKPRIIPRIHN